MEASPGREQATPEAVGDLKLRVHAAARLDSHLITPKDLEPSTKKGLDEGIFCPELGALMKLV